MLFGQGIKRPDEVSRQLTKNLVSLQRFCSVGETRLPNNFGILVYFCLLAYI